MFTTRFDWMNVVDAAKKNKEYFQSDYGFEFTISVEELGRENLQELIDFLRDELGDYEGAAFIESLGDEDDIFSAFNYLFNENYVSPTDQMQEQWSNSEFGQGLKACKTDEERNEFVKNFSSDYEDPLTKDYTEEIKAFEEKISEPNYVYPKFDYNSIYGFGLDDGTERKTNNYGYDLNSFLKDRLLDKINAVIKEDPEVRERFVKVAAKNFNNMEAQVPDDYGVVEIPTSFNMASFSITNVMGVSNTSAQERALNSLKAFTSGAPTPLVGHRNP